MADKSWEESLTEVLDKAGGEPVEFWLRDDDAVRDGPRLRRLFKTAARIPINLAVIPESAEKIDLPENVFVLQHGYDHSNQAKEGEEDSEFPASRGSAKEAFVRGIEILDSLFQNRFRRVFVPPWNRISPNHFSELAEAGFTHLSSNWRSPPSQLIDRPIHVNMRKSEAQNFLNGLKKTVERGERSIGIVTHHAIHDEKTWESLEKFILLVENHPRSRWGDLFVSSDLKSA